MKQFGYALFFMTPSALDYLEKSGGWAIGTGPSIVVVDQGMARSLTTTSARSDVYAFVFDQKGLMGGMGIEGSKITQISPAPQKRRSFLSATVPGGRRGNMNCVRH